MKYYFIKFELLLKLNGKMYLLYINLYIIKLELLKLNDKMYILYYNMK